MELQTKRLILRAWKESDAKALYKYARNPNVGPIAGWTPHTSIEDSLEIIKTVLSVPESYAVVLKETGEAVGSIAIMNAKSEIHTAKIADKECEIGFWIGEPYWGQCLIPEALNELIRYAFENLKYTTIGVGIMMVTRNLNVHKRNAVSFTVILNITSLFHYLMRFAQNIITKSLSMIRKIT